MVDVKQARELAIQKSKEHTERWCAFLIEELDSFIINQANQGYYALILENYPFNCSVGVNTSTLQKTIKSSLEERGFKVPHIYIWDSSNSEDFTSEISMDITVRW